jgi:hypothetical protein
MRDQHRLVILLGEFGEGRVDQERHVVVQSLKHRDIAATPSTLDLKIGQADNGGTHRPGRAEMRVGRSGDIGKVAGRVRREILGRNPAEQVLDELRGHGSRCAIGL